MNLSLSKLLEFKDIPVPVLESNEDYTKLVDYIINLPQELYKDNKDEIKGVIILLIS